MNHVLLSLLSIWHCFRFIAPWLILVFIPSVIVGLTNYPRRRGPVRTLMRILNFTSVLVHRDSHGTFKAPFAMSLPPSGRPPRDAMCGRLSGGMSIVLSMGPLACVMAVLAVLCAMAMNGCEPSVRAMPIEVDMAAIPAAPLFCGAPGNRDRGVSALPA